MTVMVKELDVRPLLRGGGEPFPAIMEAVAGLSPGEGLRLLTTFRPVPLFNVMAQRGFECEASERDGGDWEVLFTPAIRTGEKISIAPALADKVEEPQIWPDPVDYLDLGDLPPEAQAEQIRAALEDIPPGAVIFAVLPQEPVFLYAELIEKGHQWAGNFDELRTAFRVFIRSGPGPDKA